MTHSGEGEGLLFYGSTILPFVDHFPKNTELYAIMTTKPLDFIVRHVADDTRHIRKSGKLACPLAAVACDDLIAAILTGTHQRGLIDTRCLDRLHKPLHLRIIPDTKWMIFERVQIRQVEINDLLFFGAGSVTGLGRLFRLGGSGGFLLGSRSLTLGHFVPLGLFRLGGSLVSLGRATTAGVLRLFALLVGRGSLFCRGLDLTRLLTGGGEIHHLASRGGVGIVLAGAGGLLIVFVRLGLFRDGHAGRLRRIWDKLNRTLRSFEMLETISFDDAKKLYSSGNVPIVCPRCGLKMKMTDKKMLKFISNKCTCSRCLKTIKTGRYIFDWEKVDFVFNE